jgi:hypothetical protein
MALQSLTLKFQSLTMKDKSSGIEYQSPGMRFFWGSIESLENDFVLRYDHFAFRKLSLKCNRHTQACDQSSIVFFTEALPSCGASKEF